LLPEGYYREVELRNGTMQKIRVGIVVFVDELI